MFNFNNRRPKVSSISQADLPIEEYTASESLHRKIRKGMETGLVDLNSGADSSFDAEGDVDPDPGTNYGYSRLDRIDYARDMGISSGLAQAFASTLSTSPSSTNQHVDEEDEDKSTQSSQDDKS